MYEILLYLNLLAWVGFCVFFVTRSSASIFHPAAFYLFFHGLVFVIRPLAAFYGEYDGLYYLYEFMPSPAEKNTTMLAIILGLFSFMLPCLFVARERFEFRQTEADEMHRRGLTKPFYVMAAICAPIAMFSILSVIGGISAGETGMALDAETGFSINTSGSGYFKDAQFMLVPICALFAWHNRFRWWSLIPMASFIVLRASTGGRWPFVIGSATLALLFLYQSRSRWLKPGLVAVFVVMLAGFQAIGADRGAALREVIAGASDVTPQQVEEKERLLEGMDFANLEYFEYIVYVVPDRAGTYDYFLANLQLFTEPVPRSMWPGKPVGAPIQPVRFFDYGYPIGMTQSMPGAGWYALGWGGVIIWCGLFGLLFGKFYSWFARSRQRNWGLLLYTTFLPQTLLFFRDGTVLTLVKGLVFFIVPLGVMWAIHRLLQTPRYADIEASLAFGLAGRTAVLGGDDASPKARRQALAAGKVPPVRS